MQKVLFSLGLVFSLLQLSCKKEYRCVCTETASGHVKYGDPIKTGILTKKAADETCKANNDMSAGGLSDCHLED